MTLYRQLLIVLQSLFLLIFVGTLVLGVQGVRAFLADQLAAHAQDTATSLGLSLSPAVEADDRATMTAMVDAIFDRGYYRSIVLESVDGRPLIERRLDVVVEGVPDWLVRWVPLETPEAEALVMAGWRQAATVRVVSHPGYAYRLLRDSLLELGAWFAALALLASLLAWGAVRVLLRPLHAVERQAEALCRREYDVQARLPRTRELRNIVLAMNRMIERVRAMFDDQAREAERLREQAFRDPLTGLGNRRLFEVPAAEHPTRSAGNCSIPSASMPSGRGGTTRMPSALPRTRPATPAWPSAISARASSPSTSPCCSAPRRASRSWPPGRSTPPRTASRHWPGWSRRTGCPSPSP